MATTCPENENATECLLRALLQFNENQANVQAAKFDWDPITFAFTVPIERDPRGILAAVFALVTIFQTVLASGPGRRKSSSRTIGNWASKTTTEWNRHDFNVVSFARTPVLRSRKIQEILEQKPPIRIKATSATSQGFKESSAGTWLKLLQYVGLQDLDIGKDDLQITAADYLPDDILAVPAYADLGFIVAVVAAAGAYSFKTDSQSVYPVIIGDGFQFDFRQHPQLGMLGAFSRYGKTIGSIETPSTDRLIRALRHSRGEIEVGPSFLLVDAAAKEDADAAARDRSRVAAQEETQKQPLNIFFPAKPAGILQTLTSHECERPSTLCRCSPDLDWDDDYHLLWLFVAKLPEEIPATFPSKQSNFGKILQMLALNSRFWSS
ncbi:hypothetical protein L207DRAFT_376169, partial [Hyaloscypha variabilis F]